MNNKPKKARKHKTASVMGADVTESPSKKQNRSLKDIESEVAREGRRKEVAPESRDQQEVDMEGELTDDEGRPEATAAVEADPQLQTTAAAATPQLHTAAVAATSQVQTAAVAATPTLEPQGTTSNVRDGHSPQSLSTSTTTPTEVATDKARDSWESFVVEFQESMQVYREKVRKFKDDGEQQYDVDVWAYERHVRELGLRLVRTWRSQASEDDVKVRAKQLLNYVAAYCESTGRITLRDEFLLFIAQCVEGIQNLIEWFFQHLF